MTQTAESSFKLYEWYKHYLEGTIPEDLPSKWLDKYILPDGSLTESGAHDFCYRKKLPKDFILALAARHISRNSEISPEINDWLLKCRLICADGSLTELGVVKLAESYPLAKQTEFLDLPLKIIGASKDESLSHEYNAIQNLKDFYPDSLILHDEGRTISTVFYICILAKHEELLAYSNMSSFDINEKDRYLIGLDTWSFDATSIIQVCAAVLRIEKKDFNRGFDIAASLHQNAGLNFQTRGLHNGLEFYWNLFEKFGANLVCELIKNQVSKPYLSFPDLTIISDIGISFIEVKVKDKLSFNQIYTFLLLKDLKLSQHRICDLGVVKMDFSN